jgi:tetratricopeptide (TPR) repeat protein
LEALIANGEGAPEAYLNLAAIRLRAQDTAKGTDLLRRGIEQHPDHIRLRAALVSVHVDQGELDPAIALVHEIIQRAPDQPAHRFQLAQLNWQADRHEEVAALFAEMRRSAPENDNNRIRMAQFYADRGMADQAEAILTAGIAERPDSARLHMALSRLHFANRKIDAALAAARQCLTLSRDPADPDVLEARNLLARIHLSVGDLAQAAMEADAVIVASPKNLDAQLTRGQVFLRQGDGLNAIAALRTVVAEKPENTAGHLHLAQAHLVNKENHLAQDTLAAAVRANPEDVALRHALARLFVLNQNMAGAERELRLIVAQKPGDMRVRADLGDFLLSADRADEAMAVYKEIIADAPQVPAGYLKLAQTHGRRQEWPAAVAILEEGHRMLPQSPHLLTALVQAYMAAGQSDAALDRVKGRLAQAPTAFEYNLLGEIELTRKAFGPAEQAFAKAVAAAPEWPQASNNLARAYLAQGKQQEAMVNLRQAIARNPQNRAAYMALAYLHQQTEAYDQSRGIYEEAVAAMPDFRAAANNLAYMLAEGLGGAKDPRRALSLAEGVVQAEPEKAEYLDTLGWAYHQEGQYDLALLVLEKAISHAPDSAVINYHLGMALLKTQRPAEARERLEKAVSGDEAYPGRADAVRALDQLKTSG